jgi:hypothetical protein
MRLMFSSTVESGFHRAFGGMKLFLLEVDRFPVKCTFTRNITIGSLVSHGAQWYWTVKTTVLIYFEKIHVEVFCQKNRRTNLVTHESW